jgi:hypothetical protein
MTIQRAFLAVLLSLAAAPALAQEAMSADSTSSMESLGSTSLFAAPPPGETALVPIKGVVSGSPESVNFSGDAKVSSRHAADPDFNKRARRRRRAPASPRSRSTSMLRPAR